MMAALKAELKEHPGVAAVRSYGCRWEAGEVTGLEAFVDQVVADVWALLQRHFLQGPPPSLQEAFLAAKMAAASARQRLVAATAAAIQDGRHSRLLVTGEPGDGRTVFLVGPPPYMGKGEGLLGGSGHIW
ncbi:telomerase protein component 1-like, partial [Anas acuta]|uniref:telomerase protein component 1-like n=1 Tax=Anas acuta TaxID=28680 RepID=UPI0035C893F7